MKKRTIQWYAMLSFLLTTYQAFGQLPKQKIFPDNLKKAAFFSWNTLFADNTLFVSDPEYKTPDVNRGCNIGYGAMHVYKQINGNWTTVQTMLPDYGTTNENKLGYFFSYKSNLLVLSAEREDFSSTITRAGAMYVYRRGAESSNFTRIGKIFASTPTSGEEFSGKGIATNGNKIIVYSPSKSQLCLYNVAESSVTLASVTHIGSAAGVIQGITSSNIVVLQNENNIRLFRIDGNALTEINATSISATGSNILGGKAAIHGNTIVFETYQTFTSGSRIGFLKVVKLNYNGIENISEIQFPLGLAYNNSSSFSLFNNTISDINVIENGAIAVSFSKSFHATFRKRVAVLPYIEGQYRITDVIEAPKEYENVIASWGASVALTPQQIFIGDFNDGTNRTLGQDGCSTQNASGALYVYNLNSPVTDGTNGSRIISSAFPEINNKAGEDVAVAGNYALVGQPLSDDVEEDAGGVSLLKKINGQWYLEKKIYSIISDKNENFGNSVSLSSSFAAIGAQAHQNGSGLVHVLPVLSSAGVKIENGAASFINPPDPSTGKLFGNVVSTDGNYLAVGAPGDDAAGMDAGAVYIYNWNGTTWNFQQKIVSPQIGEGQDFGASVSLKGNFLAIGSPLDDNLRGTDAGAIHIYLLSNGVFGHVQKIIPNETRVNQFLGRAVSLSADFLAANFINNTILKGYVHIFKRSGTVWNHDQILNENSGNEKYGQDISIDGLRIVVSSPIEGRVYRYERYNSWTKSGTLGLSSETNSLALSVSLSGDNVAIGGNTSDVQKSSKAYLYYYYSVAGARLSSSDMGETKTDPEASLRIHPNPATEGFVTLSGISDVESLNAYSMSGAHIAALSLNEQRVDISTLKAGIYILHARTESGTKYIKLVVK